MEDQEVRADNDLEKDGPMSSVYHVIEENKATHAFLFAIRNKLFPPSFCSRSALFRPHVNIICFILPD